MSASPPPPYEKASPIHSKKIPPMCYETLMRMAKGSHELEAAFEAMDFFKTYLSGNHVDLFVDNTSVIGAAKKRVHTSAIQ